MDAKVEIVVKSKKHSWPSWKPMSACLVTDVEDAKQKIRDRSDVMDRAFDFAIRVTTIEPYSERNAVELQ